MAAEPESAPSTRNSLPYLRRRSRSTARKTSGSSSTVIIAGGAISNNPWVLRGQTLWRTLLRELRRREPEFGFGYRSFEPMPQESAHPDAARLHSVSIEYSRSPQIAPRRFYGPAAPA